MRIPSLAVGMTMLLASALLASSNSPPPPDLHDEMPFVAEAPLPPPVVSASTLTVASRDSVGLVVAWNRRCAGAVCPTAWDVSVTERKTATTSMVDLAFRRVTTRLRDTIRLERAACPLTQPVSVAPDTAIVTVRAVVNDASRRSDPGMYKVPLRCVSLTGNERTQALALADSYPATGSRTVVSEWGTKVTTGRQSIMRVEQMRIARTAIDSAWINRMFDSLRVAPDSVKSSGSLTSLRLGYRYTLCELKKNRYTGQVMTVTKGDESRCERQRQAYQSERSG